jgi:6-phosphogluconolactonase/glucosamine-6-phosphate isomerase/deaminase
LKIIFKNSLEIFNFIFSKIKKNHNIILSGGSSIKKILHYLNKNKNLINNNIYLSDERVSNKLIIRNDTFFKKLIKKKFIRKSKFYNYNKYFFDQTEINYLNNKINNKKIDLAILGLGGNCHIASIFTVKKKCNDSYYFINNSPKRPKKRITISLNKILSSKKIFLICNSEKKKYELKNVHKYSIIKKIKKKTKILIYP